MSHLRRATNHLVIVCMAVAAAACSIAEPDPRPTRPLTQDEVVQAADSIIDGLPLRDETESDVLLLAARGRAQLARADLPEHAHELRALLDALIIKRTPGHSGGWGWGLSYEWDAFSDGSVNPTDAIYSYTTAATALAFLDGYNVLGDRRFLRAADKAALSLLTDTCCWREGELLSVWYDNLPTSHRYTLQVNNVNGLALAVMARLDEANARDEHASVRRAMEDQLLTDQGEGFPLAAVQGTPVSQANWRYSRSDPARPNDLLHETFIVEGLLEHGSEAGRAAALRSLRGMFESHFDASGHPRNGPYTQGSRGWGPPAALYALSSADEMCPEARAIAQDVMSSISDGHSTYADPREHRAQAWYALGLARFAASSCQMDAERTGA